MSISHTIRTLFDIQDENINFNEDCARAGTKNGHACTFLEGTLTYTPTQCDRCHAENEDYTIIKNGTKTSTIVIPAGGTKKTYLKLRKQRFYCKQCQKTFVAKTSLVNEGCFISKDTCLQAGIKTAEARSVKDIARDCAVSPTTVQREINKASQELQTYDRTLPENLSFDEFKVAKGQMAFIYIDVASGNLLDILPQRDGRTIRNHFTTYFTFKQRKNVKTVTIDMNASYQGVIKDLFPNAKIIIDRFHIVQLMTRAMNKTRVKIMQAFNTSNGEDKKKYRRLKRYWRLMLKPSEDLSSTEYKHYTMFGQLPSKSVVDTMLEYSDELKANHDFLQRFFKAFDDRNYDDLEEIVKGKLDDNISSYMKTSIKTLKEHLPPIQNSFDYTYNNGRIEGINNKIKVLNRVAYGYRNFKNYKNRILLHFAYKPVEPQKKKTQNKTHVSAA